jgi:serine protease inhibitor
VASAVTALSASATSARMPPPVSITVDRPFVFQIFDVKTGATLFIGHVADPRAT